MSIPLVNTHSHSTLYSYSSTYSGGGSNLSARISCTTRRKLSTSSLSPSTSVGESKFEPELPGERGSLLEAVPVCEPVLDDAATDGAW